MQQVYLAMEPLRHKVLLRELVDDSQLACWRLDIARPLYHAT